MIRPVFQWPMPVSSAPSSTNESSSKLMRSALTFLSTIRVAEEENFESEESSNSPFLPSRPKSEQSVSALSAGHADLGWGARMRGDARTRYIFASDAKTNKPHRFYLSWDGAYPAMVMSLVLPAQGQNLNVKSKPKGSNLVIPRFADDGTEEVDIVKDELSNRESSSEDEPDPEIGEKGGTSFRLLLNRHSPERDPAKSPQMGSPSLFNELNMSPLPERRSRRGVEDESDKIKFQDLSWDTDYSFDALDDSRIIQGKHRVVQNLSSARVSILPYVKTKVLKEELNSVFREQHPTLPDDLTLSMLRKVKRDVLEVAKNCDCELSTVALAYVYFEKLVLKCVVHKANRKVVAFTCLLVAFKFNEYGVVKLHKLLQEIERVTVLNRSDILSTEFAVLSHLRFNLALSGKDYFEHFVRLMRAVDVAPSEYLERNHDEITALLKTLATQDKVADEVPSDNARKRSRSSSELSRKSVA